MENRLKEAVWFWSLWEKHKRTNNGTWSELTSEFKKNRTFKEALTIIENKVLDVSLNLIDGFDDSSKIELERQAKKIYKILKRQQFTVITYDQFHKFPALKNIKNSFWFFVKGNINILSKDDEIVSVVGSRKTPTKYFEWIESNVPKTTIVSGLAFGADLLAHEWSMKYKLPIIVFPGIDIYKTPTQPRKKAVYEYALWNGVLISDIFPGSKSFDKSIFLKRNKWMAQMVNKSYAIYFEGKSGTLSHLL